MNQTTQSEPSIARAVHGRRLDIGGRAWMFVHTDGYAHIDLLTRREPRFASDFDPERPEEWVLVERYTTADVRFDDTARAAFDAWVESKRPELEQPGVFLQTY